MKNSISNSHIARNTIMSVFAQGISLITSIIINLVVPKFIDGYQYSYWQTYILYSSYVGILHFGLLDGIVLRFSQYDYDELSKKEYGFHFYFLVIMLLVEMIFTFIIANIFVKNSFKEIIFLVAISIVSKNIFTFASYTFQISNRITEYVFLVISQRMFYGLFSVLLLAIGIKDFYFYCIADIAADIFGFILNIPSNKELFVQGLQCSKRLIMEVLSTMKSGIFLMIANFSNNFIVGSAKIAIQNFWPTLIFGEVSFSFSITNFFLSFVMAISVVLFPSIKRMDVAQLPNLYDKIREVLTPILFIIMTLYYPGCYILKLWLPKYQNSLIYVGLLLPIIVYSTRVSLLTNNYLKAYRKEKKMLTLNVVCIILELIGIAIICNWIKNIEVILIWTVFITAVKSIFAELIVSRLIQKDYISDIIMEIVVIVLFIIITKKTSGLAAYLIFSFVLLLYFV